MSRAGNERVIIPENDLCLSAVTLSLNPKTVSFVFFPAFQTCFPSGMFIAGCEESSALFPHSQVLYYYTAKKLLNASCKKVPWVTDLDLKVRVRKWWIKKKEKQQIHVFVKTLFWWKRLNNAENCFVGNSDVNIWFWWCDISMGLGVITAAVVRLCKNTHKNTLHCIRLTEHTLASHWLWSDNLQCSC